MTPPPTPVSPSPNAITAVSGGTGNATTSGLSPASGYVGALGSFTGPHYIEEQFLQVDYWRAPWFTFNGVNSSDFSLSSTVPMTTVVSGSIMSTGVWAKVRAGVRITKSYDRFETSSYQQPQRFEVLSTSADVNGNTYGAVAAGCLGPAGSIMTSQKFYNRRAWAATDLEIDHSTECYTYLCPPSSTIVNSTDYFHPAYGWDKMNQQKVEGFPWNAANWKFPELMVSYANLWGQHFHNRMSCGRLNGPYIGANEQTQFVEDVLEWTGLGVAGAPHKLYAGSLAVASANREIAAGSIGYFDGSAGGAIPEYKVSRHDYS